MYFFYHGIIPKEVWLYSTLLIVFLALILAIPTALVRYFLPIRKLFDPLIVCLMFFAFFTICQQVFSPSSTTIFDRYVIDKKLISLSEVEAAIDYEENGNHVVRCKFTIDENEFENILNVKDYSPITKRYLLEFPSIRKLSWWDNNLNNFPMYLGLSINQSQKVAHINNLWYDKDNETGYFLQFRLPSEKDKELNSNLKQIK